MGKREPKGWACLKPDCIGRIRGVLAQLDCGLKREVLFDGDEET